ncbi:MAG: AI-2E family transporter [Gammaproteobacteria bacterium]|nr:AI-2E family transporter [Gammaproteobacteria bacterium]
MIKTWNKTSIIILIVLISGLLYLLAPILTPFLIAALLAYLANPLVMQLMRFRIPRLFSVIIVFVALFILIILFILLLIPLIQTQIETLSDVLPKMIVWVQDTILPWLSNTFGISQTIDANMIKTTVVQHLDKTSTIATQVVNTVVRSGFVVVAWLINLILIPVVTFYLLRDSKIITTNMRSYIPRSIEPTMIKLFRECDQVLSAFFRGQLLVMLSLGIFYAVGLTLAGLSIGIILGIIIGIICIVPYLGMIVGISTATIAALVQYGDMKSLVLVWLVFAIGQLLESFFLTPYLVGDRIGLHPVAVIFAILAGGSLFGFCGVLLALPVAAVIMVWLRFFTKHYQASNLYK